MKHATNHSILLLSDDPAIADSFRRIAAQMISWEERPADEMDGSDAASAFRPWSVEATGELPEALGRIRQAIQEHQPYALAVVGSDSDDERRLKETCYHLLNADRFLPVLVCSAAGYERRDELAAFLAAPERVLILKLPFDESLVRHWLASQADRRDARARLLQYTRELASARASSARAKELVEEVSRAKTEFLSNINHELRTPMNAILGFSRLLLEEPLPSEQAEKLRRIHGAATSLMEILENMLDLALLSEQEIHTSRGAFRLDRVLQEVVDDVRPSVQGKGLGLYSHIEQAIPRWLEGDEARLRQILGNLVSNAIKFTQRGEIHIRATLDEEDGQNVTVRVVVSDTGVGIPLDRQAIIFDAFAQADGSVTRRFGGVGIGLSICKQLLDLLGGQIGFRSTEGEGSSFWFTVPFHRHQSPEPEEAPLESCRPAPSVPGSSQKSVSCEHADGPKTRHVLVVEDESLSRAVLELVFVHAGCFVDLVSDACEALAAMENHRYDLVVVGAALPEENLQKVVERVHDGAICSKDDRSSRLILMGQLDAATARQRCLALGADGFLSKPLNVETLLEVIGRVLPGLLDSFEDQGLDERSDAQQTHGPHVLLPQWIVRLHEASSQQDFQVLEHGAELLKNMAIRWGAQAVADHAMRVQLAARNRDGNRAAEALERLIACCCSIPRWYRSAAVSVAY